MVGLCLPFEIFFELGLLESPLFDSAENLLEVDVLGVAKAPQFEFIVHH